MRDANSVSKTPDRTCCALPQDQLKLSTGDTVIVSKVRKPRRTFALLIQSAQNADLGALANCNCQ